MFGEVFGQIVCQVFDQIFGQVSVDQGVLASKIQCTVLLGQRDTVYSSTGPWEKSKKHTRHLGNRGSRFLIVRFLIVCLHRSLQNFRWVWGNSDLIGYQDEKDESSCKSVFILAALIFRMKPDFLFFFICFAMFLLWFTMFSYVFSSW